MADQPDFEKMTPDEIMAWMESLAKRQGATEGFTTAADVEIPEVDPETVVIDEPGYIPYSESRAGSPLDETQAGLTAAPPPAASRPAVAAPAPVPPPQPPTPAWTMPPRAPEAPKPEPKREPESQGSLAWLESLARQNEDSLFNLDLSGLGEEPEEPAAIEPARWLEAMAAAPELERAADDESDGMEDTGSLLWLESLARRRGAPADELTTAADLELDEMRVEPEAPAYTPFSFDTTPAPRSAAPGKANDPAAFLGSLAASEGYSEAGVLATREPAVESADESEELEEIKRAISEGRVTSDQIHTLFEHQADIAESLPPGLDELTLDEEEALVPAELPDWLLDQVEVEAEPEPAARSEAPPIESLFEQPTEPDFPDWLRDDADEASLDLQDIFADVESPAAESTAAVTPDATDPWVEALDLEHSEGKASVDEPPPWYLRNVSDPARLAAVEGAALNPEPLPAESELPPGQSQPVPAWMTTPETPISPAPEGEGVPDWLLEMENVVTSSEIPAWLNEPVDIDASDELPFELEEAPPTPEFIMDTPAALPKTEPPAEPEPTVEPAPAPVAAGAPSLSSARQRRQSGDTAGALTEYEALIRAGDSLTECVEDLAHVARLERENPVIYRVLGDGYMRLGKLQMALDTYREALNHL